MALGVIELSSVGSLHRIVLRVVLYFPVSMSCVLYTSLTVYYENENAEVRLVRTVWFPSMTNLLGKKTTRKDKLRLDEDVLGPSKPTKRTALTSREPWG